MTEYKAPLRDALFVLNEVFEADKLWQSMAATSEVSSDLASAVLEEGAKICENVLFPINRSGDEEGCVFESGQVTTPQGFKQAYQTLGEGGWIGLGGSSDYSGQGMPKMLTVLFEEMLFASNQAFTLYPVLSSGAALALSRHAAEDLKRQYLPKMYEGIWAGSMCLTEPHSGTDLGLMRTKAEPNPDGSYSITGTKIFITGGDHDLTPNIIHLVLAKLPDAPAGTKGISLFLVPKILVDESGVLTEPNQVSTGSIEHKMGIKGSATCVMNFDGAKGWLVGEPNKGLAAMFTMMNYERLSIGIQGQGAMEMAYQHACAYAKERLQSRSLSGVKAPEKPADPIIVHADVRRMLLTIKAFCEGGRAFAAYTAMQLDLSNYSEDEAIKRRAEQMVALLTPVAKAFLTDRGLESCVLAQQVFGGHGYIREWGVEQLVRDVRIAQIYEGTNGVQAMDLISRKIVKSGGALIDPFLEDIDCLLDETGHIAELSDFTQALADARTLLQEITQWVVNKAQKDPEVMGAAAVDYLDLMGYVAVAFVWLKMVNVSAPHLIQAESGFYQSKLETAKFFYNKLLPKIGYLASVIKVGAEPVMAMDESLF